MSMSMSMSTVVGTYVGISAVVSMSITVLVMSNFLLYCLLLSFRFNFS